jgi:hypothetical protein
MPLAMAVPSIFWATMTALVALNSLRCGWGTRVEGAKTYDEVPARRLQVVKKDRGELMVREGTGVIKRRHTAYGDRLGFTIGETWMLMS